MVTINKVTEIVNNMLNHILADLTAQNKQKGNAEIRLDIGGNRKDSFVVVLHHTNISPCMDKYTLKSVLSELIEQFKTLQDSKEWDRLQFEIDKGDFSSGYYSYYIDVPTKVRLLKKPCAEFDKLVRYIKKYSNKDIALTDVFSVGIGGKRGKIFGECYEKYYLGHSSNKCEMYLKLLRENRKGRDIMIISNLMLQDHINEYDLNHSIIYETEFSGTRRQTFDITITTPKGKVKKVITISV